MPRVTAAVLRRSSCRTIGRAASPGGGPLAPVFIDETGPKNPAGLSPQDITALLEGGPTEGRKWLYPYDGTVFLRGTLAPELPYAGVFRGVAGAAKYFEGIAQALEKLIATITNHIPHHMKFIAEKRKALGV